VRDDFVNRNRLRLILLFWSLIGIADVWIDQWAMSLVFGGLTYSLGTVILIAGAGDSGPQRKESRGVGLLLLVVGILFTLSEAYGRFVIRYR
jgi:hypothetical protein